jgi:hypothetical protein
MGIGRPGWVVLAAVAAVSAPGGDAVAQSLAPRDVQRGVTVGNRPRPDFDPLGVRLGAFRLDASLEAGLGWDSNLFGTRRNTVSDGYGSETAAVSLNSDWSRHAVGASASLDSRQYFSEGDLNWTDWSVGGFGRYDFSADTNLEARYRHIREHLDVYNFDVQTAGIGRPVPYDSDEMQVSGSTRLNRLGLLATGLYRTYRFEDVSIGGVRTPVSVNDFDTTIGAVAASYAFAPGRYVVGVVRLQDIAYSNSLSRDRDSFTWEALAGFEYDFDGVWQGRIAFGWRQRDYRGAALKTLEGPAVEGTLTWAPTQLTTVTFNVARTIEESIRQDAVSYNRTTGALRVDHEYLRNVILGAELRVDRREYESPKQTGTDGLVTLSTRYLLNRSMSVVGTYTFSTRLEATGGFQEYDRNLIQVRLRIAL